MINSKKVFTALVLFLPIMSFTKSVFSEEKKDDEIFLLNTHVINKFEESFMDFLPYRATPSVVKHIKAYDVQEPNFSEYLSTFKDISHAVGICGGFTQIAKSDLDRIQNNILAQQKLKTQEKALRFRLPRSTDIESALTEIKNENLKKDIEFLTSFKNRTARNSNNSEIEKIKTYISNNLPSTQLKYTVELIAHRRTPQKTIHIQVQGKSESRLVMGGHIDSINMYWSSHAPGADDNASGSAALIQILNTILKRNTIPNHTLDFFWYAGEESGLIGSGEIAKDYGQRKIPVVAVLQLDMLGVPDSLGEIYLEKDYSSTKLNGFITEVATSYLPSVNIVYTSCGYPCSDHSSWYQERFPVVYPTASNASKYNSRIHTDRDTEDTIDYTYAVQVTRLSLAYVLAADNHKW